MLGDKKDGLWGCLYVEDSDVLKTDPRGRVHSEE